MQEVEELVPVVPDSLSNGNLTLEELRDRFDGVIGRAARLREQLGLVMSLEAASSLDWLLSEAMLLRPLTLYPNIWDTPLYQEIPGGFLGNESRGIDLIGGEVADRILAQSGITGLRYHVEERHLWNGAEQNKARRLVLFDPLDGTRNLGTAMGMGSGVIFYDTRGNFLAGGAANLSNDGREILLVDGESVYLFDFDHQREILEPREIEIDNMPGAVPLRTAYLTRDREEDLKKLGLKQMVGNPAWDGFGPNGLFRLLKRKDGHRSLDAMIDPRGQKWYEGEMWGKLAESILPVMGETGQNVQFGKKIMEASGYVDTSAFEGRQKLFISANEGIAHMFQGLLAKNSSNKQIREFA